MILFLLACQNDEDITVEPATYYQDIAPIMATNCLSCHREGGSGPFSLETYENVKVLSGMIEDSVVNRRMPPFHVNNSGDCQDFQDSPWLSDEEIAKISNWTQNDTPEGEPVDIPLPSFEEPVFDTTHSVTFEPYEANFATAADDYRCFIVDPQIASESFLTGFEVLPSNRAIAHHMILYAPLGDQALQQAYAMDEAEPGAGYSCYGGPKIENRMIAPWAPGTDQWYYPSGTGVRMEAGQKLILQMHYSNASEDTLDSTTVNLHVQETIDTELSTEFYVHSDIEIPPNNNEHVEVLRRTVRSFSGLDVPVAVHAIGPHLHKLGISSSAKIIRGNNEECMIDVPHYDFNWQRVYTFDEPIILQPEDKLEIECIFDSSDVTTTTYWGDGTNDEMCLMTVFSSPL